MAILIIFTAILLICIIFPSHDNSEKNNKSLQRRNSDNSKLPQKQYMEYGRTKNTKTIYGNHYEFNNCKFYVKNNSRSRHNSRKNSCKHKSNRKFNNRNHSHLKGHEDDIYNNLSSEINDNRHLIGKR